jgi:hypothetical protein
VVLPLISKISPIKPTLSVVTCGVFAVTLDWWGPEDGCHNCGGRWRNASATMVDLQSPRLRLLAKTLSPAILRLGGSLDKNLEYWLPTVSYEGRANTIAGAGAATVADADAGVDSVWTLPPPPPSCAIGSTTLHLCLNASRWDAINEFSADTGLQLVLGLSLNMTQNENLIR